MARSVLILLLGWLGVGLLTLSFPRVTPPGGLVELDYLLMCVLPGVAFFAGRRWHQGSVFRIYGALGMLLFIPGYLLDGRLGLRFMYGHSTPVGEVAGWGLGILVVAILCDFAGRAGRESRTQPDRPPSGLPAAPGVAENDSEQKAD